MRLVDSWIVTVLTPLAIYLALSGLDDLFVDAAWLVLWLRDRLHGRRAFIAPTGNHPPAERRIAIFVPLWHENSVIGAMLAHNVAAIRYSSYAFFVGAYPNDEPTLAAVREVEARLPNVHLAVCPHDGPTSKADCLNWIYQHVLLHEERTGEHFDLILTHDAEDIIHPDSLPWVNQLSHQYDFIQIPVLALPTPFRELTHGVYCDEFAEFQTRDLPVRNRLGGFVPSAGVGTAYSRRAIEALAEADSNRVFEPSCLTEDYENGRRLHDLGFRQVFVPPSRCGDSWVATREYFPQSYRSAIRQRTRWVTGISFQGWERHGWTGGWKQIYWVWRDRKGLLGSPLSLATNVLTLYALSTGLWWRVSPPPAIAALFAFTLGLQFVRTAVRIGCVQRLYGWRFAALVPLRAIWANIINAAATLCAFQRYAAARITGQPLVWLKTSHAYPSTAALLSERRKIGEILVQSGYVDSACLTHALATQPAGLRIGEWLILQGHLAENQLYKALSLQQGMPLGAPREVSTRAARALPAHVQRHWRVLPFLVDAGRLFIAAPEVPSPALCSSLQDYTRLEIRFHLVTPSQFEIMKESVR